MEDRFTGKRLDGRYEIHDLIGVGGMAYVYRAFDRSENRWVAIKILKEELADNNEFLRRFRNESKAIAMLSHPNIVKVYDVSFGDQIQYIVMEYIDGITLKQYIEQEGVIRWNEAVHYTIQILMALEHAHSKGIVHRDIKPQNIMLLQNGTIKVADFGIARFLQSETTTMTDKAIGSVHYIAPEQARGDYITDKADIYSVGVMLYEMITGKLPFVADSAVSVALMQLQAKPVMPREINPSIPRGLEQITIHAMEKNPIDRFQSAGEMLDDLEKFKRDPATVFRYDLQSGAAIYSSSSQSRRIEPQPQPQPHYQQSYEDNYEYEEELVKSRRQAKGAMIVKGIVAAVIIVAVAVGAVWLLNNWETLIDTQTEEETEVELPNFEGMLYSDIIANEEYTENFTFTTIEGNDPDKAEGEVIKQSPQAGIKVKKGKEIELTINGAVKTVTVPDVTNYSEADAIATLKEYNLTFTSESVADDEIETGKVISTDPAAGTEVNEGTLITIKVSKGPSKKKVTVPESLAGDILYNVTAKLEEAGLSVGTISYDDESTLSQDTVISTNPTGGTEVSEGTSIDIVVSSGKGASKTINYDVPLPEGVDDDLTIQIYRSGTQVESNTVNPAYSSSYSLSFTGTTGSETIVVELEGQKYMQLTFDFDNQQVTVDSIIAYVPDEPSSSEEISGSGNVSPDGGEDTTGTEEGSNGE